VSLSTLVVNSAALLRFHLQKALNWLLLYVFAIDQTADTILRAVERRYQRLLMHFDKQGRLRKVRKL
jgi:hypothetical protein